MAPSDISTNEITTVSNYSTRNKCHRPNNGKLFTLLEAYYVFYSLTIKERKAVDEEFISKKYLPFDNWRNAQIALNRLYNRGLADLPYKWGQTGNPCICSNEEITEAVEKNAKKILVCLLPLILPLSI